MSASIYDVFMVFGDSTTQGGCDACGLHLAFEGTSGKAEGDLGRGLDGDPGRESCNPTQEECDPIQGNVSR
jgi:hypothetical protein